jgi:hypothetical protein
MALILNERVPNFSDMFYTSAVFETLEEYFATLVSYLALSPTLKMEVIRSSETSVNFLYYATSRRFLLRTEVL